MILISSLTPNLSLVDEKLTIVRTVLDDGKITRVAVNGQEMQRSRGLSVITRHEEYPVRDTFLMVFVETPIFTREVQQLLPDEHYRELQQALVLRPAAGGVIPGSGGLRKIRWNMPGSGKRGGLRLIYYWDVPDNTIYMLLIYKKSKQEDLTPEQVKVLRNLVKEWFL